MTTPDVILGGTSLITQLSQKRTMNTNDYNFNQLASVQSSLWSRFTPTDNVSWSLITNCFSNINSSQNPPANAWGIVENTATQLDLSSNGNMCLCFTGITSGLQLVIKVWVKLGTTTNFCISVNNALTWSTGTGYCFTSADGLTTTGYKQVSYAFTTINTAMNLHIGSNSAPGVTQQITGTVFVYGWQMFQVGTTTTTLETNLVVDGSLKCSSLTVNSIVMPTPSYIKLQNTTFSVAASPSTTSITWNSLLNSGISLSSTTITIPTIGVYLFGGKVSITTALTSACSFNLQTNVSGSYVTIQQCQLNTLGSGCDFNIAMFIYATTVANQEFQVVFINGVSSTIYMVVTAIASFFNVTRIA